MGLFDKKYCDICGEKIGLLGNRKLEDGNCCKNCAKGLSPWFSERRHSTVQEIKDQLSYREENREKAARFQISRELGAGWRVLFDDKHRWFTVTREKNLTEANPDILDNSQITGCRLDVSEHRREQRYTDRDGKQVSYNPPRYEYDYDFYVVITVNAPYFEEMRFQINPSSVTLRPESNRSFSLNRSIDPNYHPEYRKFQQMGNDICAALEQARTGGTPHGDLPGEENASATAGSWVCPACGGTNHGKFCEYCGLTHP